MAVSSAVFVVAGSAAAQDFADTTPDGLAGARRQAKAVLSSSSAFTRLSNVDRQKMAEIMMLNFIFQRDPYVRALKSHDAPFLAKARVAAARFRKDVGLDPSRLTLSPAGLVVRG